MRKQIPNLITFGNLICGFLSIDYAIKGDVNSAVILIFIALMLDAVDGRVARILGVSNDLGKQLDSLADIVSFGVAPAFLVVNTYLSDLGVMALIMAVLFPVFGAYRLARFNITPQEKSIKHFEGIPITAAGGLIAFIALFYNSINVVLFLIIYYSLCILMVSRLKIPSFKNIKVPINSIIFTLFLICMFYLFVQNKFKEMPVYFYAAVVVYLIYLITRYFKEKEPKRIKKKKMRLIKKKK